MCEGFMIYSGPKLQEDDPFVLVRPKPVLDAKGKKKASNSKNDDHVVR